MTNDFLHFECLWVYLDDICRLRTGRHTALPSGENRSIRSPTDVVYAKAERDHISFWRSLSARKPEERLASPSGNIQRLAVLRYLHAIRPRSLASRNFVPSLAGMPFPQLSVVLASHHFRSRVRVTA